MRAAIQEAAIVAIPLLERRIGTIAAIAKISPLMGLLGTVIAILNAFYTISVQGSYSNAATFSGDIAQALITTAIGLSIAIMAYLAHHFLHGRVRAIVNDMEYTGNAVMQFLLMDLPEEEVELSKES
jgi:biopolymer transport protein ExbB